MSGINFTDIVAVTANWLTAQSTLNAIMSFKKFYPNIPVIVVDDDSNEKDKSEFWGTYNGNDLNPELMYDPNTEKLKEYVQVPPHQHFGKGEGNAIDVAMQSTDKKWMFHFHSDYRFQKGGFLEEMMDKVDDKVCAVGVDKTKYPGLPALSGVIELVNIDLGKENGLSYKPVVVHPDWSITPYPGDAGDGFAIAAGAYYTGRLHQLGYKVVNIPDLQSKYGIHLRWEGDMEKWKQLF